MNLRLRFGLHWRKPYWLPTWRQVRDTVGTLAVVTALYLAVAYIAANTARAESETAAIAATGTVIALLNGQSIASTDGHWAAKCSSVIEAQQ